MGAIELGQLLKQARLRKGWQQQDVAARLNVDAAYISSIENGKRNWPKQYVSALADVLGLDEIDMAIAAGLIAPRPDRPVTPPDDLSASIARTVADWTPRQKRLLLAYIDAVSAALDAGDPPHDDDGRIAHAG